MPDKIIQLQTGDRTPESAPRRYYRGNSIRLRWKTGPASYVEVLERRVRDGVVVDLPPTPREAVMALCAHCGRKRLTKRRADGSLPPKCKRCCGNGKEPGASVGRDDKYCSACETTRPATDFGANKRKYDGLASECKACSRARSNERYHKNPDRSRELTLWNQFGITVADYDDMMTGQQGVCGICRNTCSSGKRLAVDHDHETGRVRGLLCGRCNRGIGFLAHDPARLQAAIAWVQE